MGLASIGLGSLEGHLWGPRSPGGRAMGWDLMWPGDSLDRSLCWGLYCCWGWCLGWGLYCCCGWSLGWGVGWAMGWCQGRGGTGPCSPSLGLGFIEGLDMLLA